MKKILILSLFFLLACSDDSDNKTFEPKIATYNFEERLPANIQTDAPIIYSQVMMMQSQMNAIGYFMTNNYTNRSTSHSRTSNNWSYGDFDVNYTYNLVGNQYQFLYTVTYQGAIYYSIEGWQMVDGSQGYWASSVNFDALGIGSQNMPDYSTEVSWTIDSGDLNMEMSFDFGDTMQAFYQMNMNNDGSGYFSYTLNGDLTYSALWNSDGSGQWTNYMTNPPTTYQW